MGKPGENGLRALHQEFLIYLKEVTVSKGVSGAPPSSGGPPIEDTHLPRRRANTTRQLPGETGPSCTSATS